jgi:hypothetical protein
MCESSNATPPLLLTAPAFGLTALGMQLSVNATSQTNLVVAPNISVRPP